jgi:hypothetical protein
MSQQLSSATSKFNFSEDMLFHQGVRYFLRNNIQEALSFFERANKNNPHLAARCFINLIHKNEKKSEINILKFRAKLSPRDSYYLGIYLLASGQKKEGINIIKVAAKAGYPEAEFQFGAYVYGKGGFGYAANWLNRAAAKGHVYASTLLGICHLEGLDVPKDYTIAQNYFSTSAQFGDETAEYYLGVIKLAENKLEEAQEHFKIALTKFQKLAKQNDKTAMFMLGICFYEGRGVTQNFAKAFEYLSNADADNGQAQLYLGRCYLHGNGVQADGNLAFESLFRAANKNLIAAKNALALCYQHGLGTEKDITQAMFWYINAAHQGDTDAMCNLAVIYLEGKITKQDIAKAKSLLNKAASQGDGFCEEFLERLNRDGLKKSRDWYNQKLFGNEKNVEESPVVPVKSTFVEIVKRALEHKAEKNLTTQPIQAQDKSWPSLSESKEALNLESSTDEIDSIVKMETKHGETSRAEIKTATAILQPVSGTKVLRNKTLPATPKIQISKSTSTKVKSIFPKQEVWKKTGKNQAPTTGFFNASTKTMDTLSPPSIVTKNLFTSLECESQIVIADSVETASSASIPELIKAEMNQAPKVSHKKQVPAKMQGAKPETKVQEKIKKVKQPDSEKLATVQEISSSEQQSLQKVKSAQDVGQDLFKEALRLYHQHEDPADAIKLLEKAAQLTPPYPGAYALLFIIHEEHGNIVEKNKWRDAVKAEEKWFADPAVRKKTGIRLHCRGLYFQYFSNAKDRFSKAINCYESARILKEDKIFNAENFFRWALCLLQGVNEENLGIQKIQDALNYGSAPAQKYYDQIKYLVKKTGGASDSEPESIDDEEDSDQENSSKDEVSSTDLQESQKESVSDLEHTSILSASSVQKIPLSSILEKMGAFSDQYKVEVVEASELNFRNNG